MTTLEAMGVSGPRWAAGELEEHTIVRLPRNGRLGCIARNTDGDANEDGRLGVVCVLGDCGETLAQLAADEEVEVLYTPRQLALLYLRFGRVRDAVNHTMAALRLVRRAVAEAAAVSGRGSLLVATIPKAAAGGDRVAHASGL